MACSWNKINKPEFNILFEIMSEETSTNPQIKEDNKYLPKQLATVEESNERLTDSVHVVKNGLKGNIDTFNKNEVIPEMLQEQFDKEYKTLKREYLYEGKNN